MWNRTIEALIVLLTAIMIAFLAYQISEIRQITLKTKAKVEKMDDDIKLLKDFPDLNHLDFKFNRSSLYKYWYINEDNTLISNVKTNDTVPSQGLGFQTYQGVMADKCCAKDQEMNFGIMYNYDILNEMIDDNYLIFEIGLAELNKIDNYHLVANLEVGGWSFFLYNNQNNDDVSFRVQHLPLINEDIMNNFSANTPGTYTTGVFHFNINRKFNTFSVVSNQTKLYTFTNVMSEKDLCPVFGVYSKKYWNGSLRLLYSSVFT